MSKELNIMLKKTTFRVLALAAFMMVALPVAGFAATAMPTDMDIKYGVDHSLKPYNKVVTYVNNGNVVLTGDVATMEQKEMATKSAMNIPGVKNVDNRLNVVGYNEARVARLETRSDSAISSQVKHNLIANDKISYENIDVRTSDGVVYLSGVLTNPSEMKMVEGAAMSVPGVKKVENRIWVRPGN